MTCPAQQDGIENEGSPHALAEVETILRGPGVRSLIKASWRLANWVPKAGRTRLPSKVPLTCCPERLKPKPFSASVENGFLKQICCPNDWPMHVGSSRYLVREIVSPTFIPFHGSLSASLPECTSSLSSSLTRKGRSQFDG
jgi:hypothetical protein